MEFAWDEDKDAANRAKHGVSLAEAALLDWVNGKQEVDIRHDYGETRILLYANLGQRMHVCVFTKRGHIFRIISLRKAKEREIVQHGI